jgi:hypothetical protein
VTAADDCFAFPERRLLHEVAIKASLRLASPKLGKSEFTPI